MLRVTATMLCGICLLLGQSAFGQTTGATVKVLDFTGAPSCEQFDPQTATCQGSWSLPGAQGEGTASATAGFGQLQALVSDSITVSVAGAASSTGSIATAQFNDLLTFPNLATNAFLRVTMTVSGSVSGNPGHGTLSAQANLGVNLGECDIQAFSGTCTTTVAVSPGDNAFLAGQFTVSANALVPFGTTGADDVTLNYQNGKAKRVFGAQFALAVVDGRGHPLRGVVIVAASGTTYPTK